MYSRNFYPENEVKPQLPENYDGTTFTEAVASHVESIPQKLEEIDNSEECSADSGSLLATLSRTPFLSGIFGTKGLPIKLPSIGLEEILILATAAILFFSKEGDKECALILLFLLFIG